MQNLNHNSIIREIIECTKNNEPLDESLKQKINFRNDKQETLLHLTCKSSLTDLFAILLANGADVEAVDHKEKKPLDILTETIQDSEKNSIKKEYLRRTEKMGLKLISDIFKKIPKLKRPICLTIPPL